MQKRIIKANVRYSTKLPNNDFFTIELATERSLTNNENFDESLDEEFDFLLNKVLENAEIAVEEINKKKNT